jgi:acetyl-CoA carboxylase biotin carboxyl carrier protein
MSVKNVVSEIAGTVWEVCVKPGDKVEAGTEILIIESMKMEIPVFAGEAGVIDAILVEKGGSVAEDQSVATIAI